MTCCHRPLEANDIALIEKVKLTPSLYDPRNTDFRLASKKNKDWQNVAALLGLSVYETKRRWTCMRDRYSRELKQLRMHPENKEYGKNEFFQLMDFLRGFVKKRRERRKTNSIKRDENTPDRRLDSNKLRNRSISTYGEHIVYDDEHSYADSYLSATDVNQMEETNVENIESCDYIEDVTGETCNDYENFSGIVYSNTEVPNKKGYNIPIVIQQSNLPYNGAARYEVNSGDDINDSNSNLIKEEQYKLQRSKMASKLSLSKGNRYQNNVKHQTVYSSRENLTTTAITDISSNKIEDDYFCKTISAYLRQLPRRHKIKAKVEMFQILEKYIELEECNKTMQTS